MSKAAIPQRHILPYGTLVHFQTRVSTASTALQLPTTINHPRRFDMSCRLSVTVDCKALECMVIIGETRPSKRGWSCQEVLFAVFCLRTSKSQRWCQHLRYKRRYARAFLRYRGSLERVIITIWRQPLIPSPPWSKRPDLDSKLHYFHWLSYHR